MPVRIVQSKQNARLKELRRALAQPGQNARGLVGIEGPNLLQEAIRAGLRIDCVFATRQGMSALESTRLPEETETLLVAPELLASAQTTDTPQPIAALVEPPDWTWAHIVGGTRNIAPLIVILASLQDPGNLGTILRSAEAFGADGVVSLAGTVSAWNPKAVRASAGSVFRLPVLSSTAEDCFMRLREAGVRILASTVHGAEPADLTDLSGPVALIIGNEGNGIPVDLIAKADAAVTVPCPGPVESLNAAVAASILLYEASQQRSVGRHAAVERLGDRT